MNKENKREVRKGNTTTIKHLEKRLKVINNITKIIALLAMCALIVTIVVAAITIKYNDGPTLGFICLGIIFALVMLMCIIQLIKRRWRNQISAKQRELKSAEIKKRAEEGSLLKYQVYCKKDTAAKVIEHDIENIVFQNVANGAITFDIHFKTKFKIATVQIPIQEIILNHLDEEMVNSILTDTITDITIDTTEEGKTQVTFLGKDFYVEQTDVTDDDLIQMFGKKIKEE